MTIRPKYPCPLAIIVNTVLIGPKAQAHSLAGLLDQIISGPHKAQPAMAPVRKPFFPNGRFERED